MLILNQMAKCHNLHNVQLIYVFIQRIAQTRFRIFLLMTRITVDGVMMAIFIKVDMPILRCIFFTCN